MPETPRQSSFPLPLLAAVLALLLTGARADDATEIVRNHTFTQGGAENPFIPAGWHNGEGRFAFQPGEIRLVPEGEDNRAIEINTLGAAADSTRKVYTPITVDINTTYEVSFSAKYMAGEYASISVRNAVDGSDASFILAVGDVHVTYALSSRSFSRKTLKYYIDSSRPYLVVQTHGPTHVVIDDISLKPLPGVKLGAGGTAIIPWTRDWQKGVVTEAVKTPHTPWAKPYARGRIRVISMLPRWLQRWTVELAQRMDVSYAPIMFAPPPFDKHPGTGLGADYWIQGDDGEPRLFRVEREALKTLSRPADCLVLGYMPAANLPDAMTAAVLDKVNQGAGLVLMESELPDLERVRGTAAWPETWTVFGTLTKEHPVIDVAQFKDVPERITVPPVRVEDGSVRIEGRELPAQTISAPNGRYDFSGILDNAAPGATAYVFLALHADEAQQATLGIGADWWAQPWINGEEVFSSYTKDGNKAFPISPANHMVEVALRKGENILAVRFSRGTASAELALAGPEQLRRALGGQWAQVIRPENRVQDGVPYLAARVVAPQEQSLYQYGKGRIAVIGEATPKDLPREVNGVRRDCSRLSFEAETAYRMRLIAWAAGKVPHTYIRRVAFVGAPDQADDFRGTLPVAATEHAADVELNLPLDEPARLKWWFDDYAGRTTPEASADIAAGARTVRIALPPLGAGTHWLHLQLMRPEGRVLDWNLAALDLRGTPGIADIVLARESPPYYRDGESIAGKVVLEDVPPAGSTLKITLGDTDGHIWHVTKVDAPATAEVPFSLPIEKAAVLMHNIEAELETPGGVTGRMRRAIVIVRQDDWYRNNYDFQVWQLPYWRGKRDYLLYLISREFRQTHGVTSSYRGFMSLNTLAGIRTTLKTRASDILNRPVDLGGTQSAPQREPCISSPDVLETIPGLVKMSKNYMKYAPLAYDMAHEANLLGYPNRKHLAPDADICFHESCLAGFREFMQAEYRTLATLNESWGTDIRDWNEVRPIVLKDALAAGQIPRWIDHRRHMDAVHTGLWRNVRDEVRRHDPDAEAISDNLLNPNSYSGVDHWGLLSDVLAGSSIKYATDFVDPARKHLTWQRYAYWHANIATPDDDLFRRRIAMNVWRGLLTGAGGSSYWAHVSGAEQNKSWFRSPIAPDLSMTEDGRWSVEPIARIRTGIDRLVFDGRRDDSGIAILYSRSSMHAATAWQALHPESAAARLYPSTVGRNQFDLFARALTSLYYGHRAVSEVQVAAGILEDQRIRLLILPFAQAIDADAVAAIDRFVAAGGTVLADIRPAMADQHGRTGPEGRLDPVFGVQHAPGWADYVPVEDNLKLQAQVSGLAIDLPEMQVLTGPRLEVRSATAAGEASGRPVMLVNPHGAGHAVLLNLTPIRASDMAVILQPLLAWQGRAPLLSVDLLSTDYPPYNEPSEVTFRETADVEVDDNEVFMMGGTEAVSEQPEVTHFVNGNLHIFGLWYSYSNGRRGAGRQEVRVAFPIEGEVYNLRTNEHLGRQASFEVAMPLEDVRVYAVVPYKIGAPTCQAGVGVTATGNPVIDCTIELEAADQRHVMQMRLFAPDGTEWPNFAENVVLQDGQAVHRFVLPLNAPTGKWNIQAREAISGLSSRVSAELH